MVTLPLPAVFAGGLEIFLCPNPFSEPKLSLWAEELAWILGTTAKLYLTWAGSGPV